MSKNEAMQKTKRVKVRPPKPLIDTFLLTGIPKKGLTFSELMERVNQCSETPRAAERLAEVIKRTTAMLAVALDLPHIADDALRFHPEEKDERTNLIFRDIKIYVRVPTLQSIEAGATIETYVLDNPSESWEDHYRKNNRKPPVGLLTGVWVSNMQFQLNKLTDYRREVLLGNIKK